VETFDTCRIGDYPGPAWQKMHAAGPVVDSHKIAEWRWLKPVFAGQFELAERPAEFTRLRDDKNPKQVMRELQGGATWRLAI